MNINENETWLTPSQSADARANGNGNGHAFNSEIPILASISRAEYRKSRKEKAKALGIGVTKLDALVTDARKCTKADIKAAELQQPDDEAWEADEFQHSLDADGAEAKRAKRKAVFASALPEGYAPPYSEEGMALSFAAKHAGWLRYVHPMRQWRKWTGVRWAEENTLATYDLIRKECRLAAARAMGDMQMEGTKKGKITGALNKANTRAAIETISRSDRRLAATIEQWDADDWLMNTPGGIIDLRTGQNIGSDPLKYCTKITSVTPGGDCPLWEAFLDKVTDGDKELQAYLKRMCGYFLTGSIRDHAMFFIYGPGGNGKSVFLNTISAILGDYHVVSPAQTFAEQKNQRHETELARLNGAPPCHQPGNRARPILGRSQDQKSDGWRQDCCSLHAR